MMRNLEQRLEEIRRRSEKMLRARKRRNQIIMSLCIPLVAVLGLWGLLTQPFGGAQADPEALQTAGKTEAVMEYENTSLICSIARIEVTLGGQTLTHTDVDRMLDIWDQLETMQDGDKLFFYTAAEDSNLTDSSVDLPESRPVTYRIVLTLHDGSTEEYLLTEAGLEIPAECKVYAVSDDQRARLLRLLGAEEKE